MMNFSVFLHINVNKEIIKPQIYMFLIPGEPGGEPGVWSRVLVLSLISVSAALGPDKMYRWL